MPLARTDQIDEILAEPLDEVREHIESIIRRKAFGEVTLVIRFSNGVQQSYDAYAKTTRLYRKDRGA